MYADRKGWPMTGMTIDLAFSRRHADDCTDCDNPKAMLDHIDCALDIQGPDLTDDQRSRIAEIADQCPVHKTLNGDLRIATTHS
jgi:putative redox protein